MPKRISPSASKRGSRFGGGEEWITELRSKAGTSRRVSWLLDECIRVPGTKLRFGIDPLLGLLPYGGETVASLIGAIVLAEAGRKGLPVRTLARMGGNMILNASVGVIPVFGDLFSFWFKSNSRNYKLLNSFLEDEGGDEASGGWWPLLLVTGVLLFVLLMNIFAWILVTLLVTWIWRQLPHG